MQKEQNDKIHYSGGYNNARQMHYHRPRKVERFTFTLRQVPSILNNNLVKPLLYSGHPRDYLRSPN